jgi:hypothetical protein
MTRKIVGQKLFAGTLGVAMLASVVTAGLWEIQSVGLALAGAASAWPAGACERVSTFDLDRSFDQMELVCWTDDFALSVPEPGGR